MEGFMDNDRSFDVFASDTVAGNGLLDRRVFLGAGAAVATAGLVADPKSALGGTPLPVEEWMKTPGAPFVPYGQPSKYEERVARIWTTVPGTTGTGTSRTPHHAIDGMITPNG